MNYIGTDILETLRIQNSINKFQEKFINRIFTEHEQNYCYKQKHPEYHFAARFCAKEAVSKALKTGISGGIKWTDIEIKNTKSGAPFVELHNKALELFSQLNADGIDISLSHSDSIAQATAIISIA